MQVLNEQEEIEEKIAKQVPVIARKSTREKPQKRKRTGFLGLLGKKEEAKPTATTTTFRDFFKGIWANGKAYHYKQGLYQLILFYWRSSAVWSPFWCKDRCRFYNKLWIKEMPVYKRMHTIPASWQVLDNRTRCWRSQSPCRAEIQTVALCRIVAPELCGCTFRFLVPQFKRLDVLLENAFEVCRIEPRPVRWQVSVRFRKQGNGTFQ